MPYRPLAIVSGLTVGDYLLWNWSLNANHDVLSLVAGLTLPPLAILCLWLIAVTGARLLARGARSSGGPARARTPPAKPARAAAAPKLPPRPTPAPTSARSSRKIAA